MANQRFAWAAVTAVILFSPGTLLAQQLEEIVVTAQRREQSLQEVPISLEAFTSAELLSEGYRTMDDLAEFSPSVEIDLRMQDQDISVRGLGSTGNSLHLEQAAPTFLDGVHFGRTSAIKGAFLDLERVEILRGPQPVYFGQNATAGAFSLVSRKPGPEWEGDITGEFGNFGRRSVEGGIGGPLTDTLGIRVAGKYDLLDGFLTDVVSGDKYPNREDKAARMILQWAPTEQFEATMKLEMADTYEGAEGVGLCLTPVADGPPPFRELQGIDALVKGRTSFDNIYDTRPIAPCGSGNSPFETGLGIKAPVAYFAPVPDINQEDSDDTGFIDNRDIVPLIRQAEYGLGIEGYDSLETYNSYLDLNYMLGNGIGLNSLSAWITYDRDYNRNNSNSPFLGNMRSRGEDFEQFSQEFRVSSPVGGMFEWMAGLYWQKNDLDIYSDNYRGNTRRPRRLNNSWEEVTWLSGFATVTFNFLDNRASLDVGGRYTNVDKTGYIIGYGARWLFEDPPDPAWVADPEAGDGEAGEFLEAAHGEDGWTIPWRTENIPPNWQRAIGITPISATVRRTPGPYTGTKEATEFDPQVTLRYRPNENLSLYAKWAQAFKAGGFNTSAGSLSDTEEDFNNLRPEYAENFEVGAKGVLWNDRARYGVTLFNTTIEDLQLQTTAPLLDPADPTELAVGGLTNAGKQRTRGVEFSFDAALSDQFTARFAGAIMDGVMVEYEGAGCTQVEFQNADTGPCISLEESAQILGVDVDADGADGLEGTIDRSGEEAPRTPDWKFTLKLDYWMPLFGNNKGILSSNFVYSDGYITNVETFSHVQKEGTHFNMNLSAGFGDLNDTWSIKFYARNMFEVQQEYNPEFDLEPDGIVTENLSQSHFRTYGVQLQYRFE